MFPNQNSQPKPVSQYVNINPDAGANPTPTQTANPYPTSPEKSGYVSVKKSPINKSIIIFVLAILTIIFAGLFVWKLLDWSSLNSTIEQKVSDEVERRSLIIQEEEAKKYEELEKTPNYKFELPSEYGELSFDYPKTWSVYVAQDTNSSGSYEAHMRPYSISSMADTVFALKIIIYGQTDPSSIISSYNSGVLSGSYVHSTVPINNNASTADVYEGQISNGQRIKIAIFRIRNQTVTLQTDSTENFGSDFTNILNSITFKE